MSAFDRVSSSMAIAPAIPRSVKRFTLTLFSATLFASALLLFSLQPMFAKMVLPRLGGSPSVWSVAMVMFQAFLFAGYLYAHLIATLLPIRSAALLHLAFLGLAADTLPLGIAAGFSVPPSEGIILWTAALFACSIGIAVGDCAAAAILV